MPTVRIDESREMDAATRRTFRMLSKQVDTQSKLSVRRNILNNGSMTVAQRSTGTAGIVASGFNTIDRYQTQVLTLGTWTQSQDAAAPPGYTKSLKMLCTTADAAPAAGDFLLVSQGIEGQNVQYLQWGSAAGLPITVSFWVQANLTGKYICELHVNGTAFCSMSYVINASTTWEQKVLTFPANLTTAITNDASAALEIKFWLAAGSNFAGGAALGQAWHGNDNTRAVGQVNLAAAINNFWQVTGIQLEVGSIATPYEHRPYGVELIDCMRYLERWDSAAALFTVFGSGMCFSAVDSRFYLSFRTTKRAKPTLTYAAVANFGTTNAAGAVINATAIATRDASLHGADINITVAAGLAAGNATICYSQNSLNAFILASCEI